MAMSGKEKLLSLLFGSGRELVNFKFFPGENVKSSDDLCDASHEALKIALDNDKEDSIPGIGKQQTSFKEVLSRL